MQRSGSTTSRTRQGKNPRSVAIQLSKQMRNAAEGVHDLARSEGLSLSLARRALGNRAAGNLRFQNL